MKFHVQKFLMITAAAGVLALAAPALAQSGRVDANGYPTDHSTPAEQAQTADLNSQVHANNAASDAQADANNAQYQAQQQQYQGQVAANQAAQDQYAADSAAYESLRSRYAAERAAYHREVWPARYQSWRISHMDQRLLNSTIKSFSGGEIGQINGVARSHDGDVLALRATLNNNKVVWIDAADLRFDVSGHAVYTDLAENDLERMADMRG